MGVNALMPGHPRLIHVKSWVAGTSPAMTTVASRHLLQPLLRIACAPTRGRERPTQLRDRIEIVDRPEFVDIRQDRAHAARLRLESFEAQQRIKPDQPPRRAVQPVD